MLYYKFLADAKIIILNTQVIICRVLHSFKIKLCLSANHTDRSSSFFIVMIARAEKKESAGGLDISYVVKA